MIETILLTFIVARYKKLNILHIFKYVAFYPVLICAVVYIYLEWTIWQGDYSFVKYVNYFKATYLGSFMLLGFYFNQYKVMLKSFPLLWLGYGMNYLAIKANNGFMPVFVSNSWATGYVKEDMFTKASFFGDYHVLGDMNTKLIPFCDTWDLGWGILSSGDILIRLFVFIVLYYSIKESNKLLQSK